MRNLFFCLCFFYLFFVPRANAMLVDITDPSLTHFGDFPNVNYPGDYSKISSPFTSDESAHDFGWHYSPSDKHGTSIGGILLGPNSYDVTSLAFQVHERPFKDFLLEGSLDTTTGFDGSWDTLLASTVTEHTELAVQSWSFASTHSYAAYRIHILNDYTPPGSGWAMYRWELLADNGVSAVPEPASMLLFGSGLVGLLFRRRIAK